MHRTHLTLNTNKFSALKNAVFVALFFCAAQISFAQKSQSPAFENLPEGACFPNPIVRGHFLTIKIDEVAANESQVFEARILDDQGRLVFAAPLPDELELQLDEKRFSVGLYVVQFFQNGELFETDELVVQ
jgi:hypothetical protein